MTDDITINSVVVAGGHPPLERLELTLPIQFSSSSFDSSCYFTAQPPPPAPPQQQPSSTLNFDLPLSFAAQPHCNALPVSIGLRDLMIRDVTAAQCDGQQRLACDPETLIGSRSFDDLRSENAVHLRRQTTTAEPRFTTLGNHRGLAF